MRPPSNCLETTANSASSSRMQPSAQQPTGWETSNLHRAAMKPIMHLNASGRHHAGLCLRIPVATLVAVLLLSACQRGVIVAPSRSGAIPEAPALGPNLGVGDAETCNRLRSQLVTSIAAMNDSFESVRRFSASYNGELVHIQAFEGEWRADFVSQKNSLFTMPTCSDFVAQWGLALAAWRDIFRYEKETVSSLRAAQDLGFLVESAREIERILGRLQEELDQ